MPFLSATELDMMRVVENSAMPSTGVIRRQSPISDGMGGYSESWANVGTVTCDVWAVAKRSDRENTTAGNQIISHSQWFITVPYDTVISAKDRIQIDGRTFEITFVPNNQSWSTALRCDAITHNEESRL